MNMKSNAKFGDEVEVVLAKEKHKGIYLQAPEESKGIVLLKLKNGYNLGFDKKEVLEIKKIKEIKKKKSVLEIKKDSSKPNVALIITGGTIASKYDASTGGVKYLTDVDEFLNFYPEVLEYVNVVKIENPFMVWSEDMTWKEWKVLAKKTEELLNDSNISGVIITHGTDFLHYSSSALSLMLGKLNKPVVLTYSQRSIDRASSDARLNLICSAKVAISDIAEVMIVGHGSEDDDFCYAMKGTKVRKLHTSRRDAFKSVNSKPFAKISEDKFEILEKYNLRNNKLKVKGDFSFDDKVGLVKFYPGQNPEILDYYFKKGYKGVVVEFAGIGQVATESSNSWVKKIKELVSKGFVICAAAQCINGRLDPYVYSSGRKLFDAGVIYLSDMLAETALIKLGWVLGHKEWSSSIEKVKEKMLHNLVGEISNRLVE
jgi:glutamyl-tRNA(Gln) amidotransferase subunit D